MALTVDRLVVRRAGLAQQREQVVATLNALDGAIRLLEILIGEEGQGEAPAEADAAPALPQPDVVRVDPMPEGDA